MPTFAKTFAFLLALALCVSAGAQDKALQTEPTRDIWASDSATIMNGRLTLTSGTAITTSDVLSATIVYLTPFDGDKISLYSGTIWQLLSFTEKSVAVPSTTGRPFDIFAYNNSGTVALEALDWTNDTTRATALTTQNGVWVKTGAATRRYLGTGYTTGVSGQTEDSVANRFLWNYYNRVERLMADSDGTNHSYSGGAWRYWNNSSSSCAVYFVVGLSIEPMTIGVAGQAGNMNIGVNLNSTSPTNFFVPAIYAGAFWKSAATHSRVPSLGRNAVEGWEYGGASGYGYACEIIATVRG